MIRRAALAVVAVACAEGVPLSVVPIHGGTAEQRAAARQAADAFARDAGPGRVRLMAIEFVPLYGDVAGRFVPLRRRVQVDPDMHGAWVERTVRHELCHALDYGEDLMVGAHPAFDDLVVDLFRVGGVDTDGFGGPRHRRGEVFAQVCELGPLLAQAVAAPCPGDSDLAAAAAWSMERVWRGWDEQPLPPWPDPAASWDAPDPSVFDDGLDVLALTDPALIRVAYGQDAVDLQIADGRPVAPSSAGVFAPREELPAGIGELCPTYGLALDGTGWSAGPAAELFRLELRVGPSLPRILASDGAGWTSVEGCVPGEHADLFATPDRGLWVAWVDGGTLRWAPLPR